MLTMEGIDPAVPSFTAAAAAGSPLLRCLPQNGFRPVNYIKTEGGIFRWFLFFPYLFRNKLQRSDGIYDLIKCIAAALLFQV